LTMAVILFQVRYWSLQFAVIHSHHVRRRFRQLPFL
jgi:hypothetical protein